MCGICQYSCSIHMLKSLFQPQSFVHVTLCSPAFLVIPKFRIFFWGNKSSVYPLHLSSTKALFSFYIKIRGKGQLCMWLKNTERQENNNRSTQRTVVERDSLKEINANLWGLYMYFVCVSQSHKLCFLFLSCFFWLNCILSYFKNSDINKCLIFIQPLPGTTCMPTC